MKQLSMLYAIIVQGVILILNLMEFKMHVKNVKQVLKAYCPFTLD